MAQAHVSHRMVPGRRASFSKLIGRMAGCVTVLGCLALLQCLVQSLHWSEGFVSSSWMSRPLHRSSGRRVDRPTGRGKATQVHVALENEGPEVSWLPSLRTDVKEVPATGSPGRLVLPFFPMSSTPFLPYTNHTISVFEPRYRELFDHILFSGSRRYVVAPIDPETRRFASYGVVLYLNDLKEVSEQTGDNIKYIGQHRAIGRVKIHEILNPGVWEDASTFLRVETEEIIDQDEGEDLAEVEEQVMGMLTALPALQKEVGDFHIAERACSRLNASRSENDGLWSVAALWGEYLEFRVRNRVNAFEGQKQQLLRDFFEKNQELLDSIKDKRQISLADFPASFRLELGQLEQQVMEEIRSVQKEQVSLLQGMVQSSSHKERLDIALNAIGGEHRRLVAMKALKAAMQDLDLAPKSESELDD